LSLEKLTTELIEIVREIKKAISILIDEIFKDVERALKAPTTAERKIREFLEKLSKHYNVPTPNVAVTDKLPLRVDGVIAGLYYPDRSTIVLPPNPPLEAVLEEFFHHVESLKLGKEAAVRKSLSEMYLPYEQRPNERKVKEMVWKEMPKWEEEWRKVREEIKW